MFKKLFSILLSAALTLFVATSVGAYSPVVYIEDLPEYTNTDTFKISYSALSSSDVTAKFYVRKDSDSTWREFGGTITGASGQVQVGGSQIYDGDGLYRFKVEISGASAETDTRIDRSGPSPVSNYWKEKVAGGFYRIHWTTPGDSDFSRVFVYRSDKPEFDANGTTKVYELGGPTGKDMTWDNVGLDSTKEYYYAIRAVDKAGNASSVVADNYSVTYVTPAPTGGVTQLPKEEIKEEEKGDVLGKDTDESNEPTPTSEENVFQKVGRFAKERTKITVGIAFVVLVVLYLLYRKFFKKENKEK